jgi:hypothetical protein
MQKKWLKVPRRRWALSLMFPSAVSMGTVLMSSSFHHHVHNMGITLLDRMTPLSRRLM